MARSSRTKYETAIVTGAAGGISSAVATRLAADGTRLILLDRDGDGLRDLQRRLPDGAVAQIVVADFTDLEALDSQVAEVLKAHPGVDLLLGAAGLDRAQSVLSFDWRQARDDFNVNTLANLVLLQQIVPVMHERRRGHVTLIASLAALIGTPYEGVYSATKAALSRLIDSFRAELRGSGVTFTGVYPGFIDTPLMWNNAYEHPYVVSLDEAADRIFEASVRRTPEIFFPKRERMRIAGGRMLPVGIRDRITSGAMNEEAVRRWVSEGEAKDRARDSAADASEGSAAE